MRIYLKNTLAKFHPDPIWNDGALGFFEKVARQKEAELYNNNKMGHT